MLSKLKNIILSRIEKEGQLLLFNILISFLISFFLAHLYSIFVPLSVFLKGYHIHHFYYGIILLAISGTIGMISHDRLIKRLMSYMLGVGVGLIVDELGLLLSCTTDGRVCSYQFPDMFDIVVYIAIIYIILIFFGNWLIFQCKKALRNLIRFFNQLWKKNLFIL